MKPRVHRTCVGGPDGAGGGESWRFRLASLDATLAAVIMVIRPVALSSAVVSPVSSMWRGVSTSCLILVVVGGGWKGRL